MSAPTTTKPRGINKGLATRHVSINLNKSDNRNGYVWHHLPLNTLEDFTSRAQAWLGDKTNLSGRTIDNADYAELLEYFRKLADWKPARAKAKRTPTVIKDQGAARTKARDALKNIHHEEPRKTSVPKKVTVAVSVPPIQALTVDVPKRGRADVPKNWVLHAKEANTPAAREWWTQYIERWLRGEV